ncbi:sensor histidine kinase [Enterococcus sp. LJL128]
MTEKQKKSRSLNTVLNTFYILFVAVVILFSLVFSSITTTREVTDTAYTSVENTLQDKFSVLNRTFNQLFEQVVNLNNNPNLIEVINNDDDALRQAVSMNTNIKELYYRFQDVLDSIYINVNNGEFFFNGGEISQGLNEIDYQNFFDLADGETKYFWLDSKESPFSTAKEKTISICKIIGDDSSEASGVIVFNLKHDYIDNLLQESFVTEKGRLFLVSADTAVTDSDQQFPADVFQELDGTRQIKRAAGENYHIQSKQFGLNQWYLAAVFPEQDLQKSQSAYLTLAAALFLFLLLAGTLMVIVVGRYISKPIRNLAKEIEATSITDHKGPLPVNQKHFNELSVLYRSFNLMIEKNERLLNENEQNHEERSRLEIELLQSQINPHFLYNTLYSIQSLSDMEMNRDASLMTRSLAEFYRTGISKGNLLISLEEELEHVQNYLTIMSYRYHDRFDYAVKIENPELLKSFIPKISLQPIVENSIYHGLKEQSSKGFLSIEIKESNGAVLVIIKDNGKGFSDERLELINEEINLSALSSRKVIGIGLRSVNLRIKKCFGSAYGLWVEKSVDGALIKLVIPKEAEE